MAEPKSKLRFNLVDFLIAGVIVALLAFGAYKLFFVTNITDAQTREITFQVLLEEIRQPSVDSFSFVDQRVKELQTSIDLGTVVSAEASPFTKPTPKFDGTIVQAEVPTKYDLLVTIKTQAVVTDNNVTVNNKEIKLGDRISLKTQVASATGVVYWVEVPADARR